MVLKGLPDDCKAYIAVTTLTENVVDFVKFKTSLKHSEETENSSNKLPEQNSAVMKSNFHSTKESN